MMENPGIHVLTDARWAELEPLIDEVPRLLRRGSGRRRLSHCRSCHERQGKKTSSYELPVHVILLTETVALEHTEALGRQRHKAAYRSRPAEPDLGCRTAAGRKTCPAEKQRALRLRR